MKKIIILLIIVMISVVGSSVSLKAHIGYEDLQYDVCNENERMWYKLINEEINNGIIHKHISHSVTTIKYYFEDSYELSSYRWDSDIPTQEAEELKAAIAESMMKWNDIYYYTYDQFGNKLKNKVVNIEEGDEDNSNLIIYPSTIENNNMCAFTTPRPTNDLEEMVSNGNENLTHYNKWQMFINIPLFVTNRTQQEYEKNKRLVGAHEVGHILGLNDIDLVCGHDNVNPSHNEVLMGYGDSSQVEDITFQDLAGVSITRGFHQNTDHIWLNCGLQNNNQYKFICSLCNGIMYDTNYTQYLFYEYGECNQNHNIDSGNLIAVGCNGNKDYVKCLYCRYICNLDNLVEQDYSYEQLANTDNNYYYKHKAINNVEGLSYSLIENHNFRYRSMGNLKHKKTCSCGYNTQESHVILNDDDADGDGIVTCVYCRAILTINYGTFALEYIPIGYTINGSYVLKNGIIVLVAADIEKYEKGELEFNN